MHTSSANLPQRFFLFSATIVISIIIPKPKEKETYQQDLHSNKDIFCKDHQMILVILLLESSGKCPFALK